MDLGRSRSLGRSARHVRTFLFQSRAAGRVLAGCMFVAVLPVKGQLLDSLKLFSQEPARLVVKLDSRGSFISNRNVRLMGVKVGLEHGGRLQYGIGYSFLATRVEPVSYKHLRAHETVLDLVCRLLLEKKKQPNIHYLSHRLTQRNNRKRHRRPISTRSATMNNKSQSINRTRSKVD